METSRPMVFAGVLLASHQEELCALEKEDLLNRMLARDVTLWPGGESGTHHLKTNLEFLNIPERLPQLVAGALRTDYEALSQGLTHRILIAFGSVYHFSEALLNTHPNTKDQKYIILESCHPGAVRNSESQTDPRKTLVVLVNKSAYRVEDHALFLYFHKRLQGEFESSFAGHFVAASQSDTFLASTAAAVCHEHTDSNGGVETV